MKKYKAGIKRKREQFDTKLRLVKYHCGELVGYNGSHGLQQGGLIRVAITCNFTGREAKEFLGEYI